MLKASQLHSKEQFEKKFAHQLVCESYKPGDLILICNSCIEVKLNQKSKLVTLEPSLLLDRNILLADLTFLQNSTELYPNVVLLHSDSCLTILVSVLKSLLTVYLMTLCPLPHPCPLPL